MLDRRQLIIGAGASAAVALASPAIAKAVQFKSYMFPNQEGDAAMLMTRFRRGGEWGFGYLAVKPNDPEFVTIELKSPMSLLLAQTAYRVHGYWQMDKVTNSMNSGVKLRSKAAFFQIERTMNRVARRSRRGRANNLVANSWTMRAIEDQEREYGHSVLSNRMTMHVDDDMGDGVVFCFYRNNGRLGQLRDTDAPGVILNNRWLILNRSLNNDVWGCHGATSQLGL